MELLTHRYRNVTVLVLVLVAQVLLLGYQVRSKQDVRLVRVWAVTGITPVARLLEIVRRQVTTVLDRYVLLVGVQQENERLARELGDLRQEARFLREELATAERAEALSAFAERTPSKTIAARIIGAGTGSGTRTVYVDRGSGDRIRTGMAVVTPEGVVGKVTAAYPTSSRVLLITDPQFAAGVISQDNHVQGTVRGGSGGLCRVDYVQSEEIVEQGEWFYTSGDDRTFPRGLPVGRVVSVEKGRVLKEIVLAPAGLSGSLNEVLIVLEGAHTEVPTPSEPIATSPLLPLPESAAGPEDSKSVEGAPAAGQPRQSTDADRLVEIYRNLGEAQGHVFGEGLPGSAPPDFNAPVQPAGQKAAEPSASSPSATVEAAPAGSSPIEQEDPWQ